MLRASTMIWPHLWCFHVTFRMQRSSVQQEDSSAARFCYGAAGGVMSLVLAEISVYTEEFPGPHRCWQVQHLLLNAPKMLHTFTFHGGASVPTHLTGNLRNTQNPAAQHFVPSSKRRLWTQWPFISHHQIFEMLSQLRAEKQCWDTDRHQGDLEFSHCLNLVML